LRQKLKKMRAMKNHAEEEEKLEDPEPSSADDDDDDDDLDLPYPEECRVLDIMKDKYLEAIRFFTDTNDKA